ncbi:ABC transporter ATP-binding protein [Wenzhouxiangella sp. AB-CW3]|nr:ABC transporter ATP-binding protein [Wenzhouxiangella sp. AB-CW3]
MSRLSAHDLDVRIGQVQVATALNLAIREGEFWGLLGPNGVGKTTLLKTLAGLHPPLTGGIRLNDRPMTDLKRRIIARHLGMLPQHTHYAFDASCLETALVGRHPHLGPIGRERQQDHDLARLALEELGMRDLASRSCMDLSGGESRRLALATLLVQDPEVMLLDEPTNHLDPANQVTILNVLHRLVREHRKTALMALHEVNLATCYCSHVLLLYGDGEWDAGPTRELLTTENLSRLYRCRVRLVDDGRQRVFAVAAEPSGGPIP